jgi:diguanylate cyclase (GGDEF)-like protein
MQPSDCHILVVDDEEVICNFLEETLGEFYKVHTCTSAAEAFELIERRSYDVVISDLRLPDHSGMEVLRHAKHRDEFTEVIIITGYASLESAAEAINMGVTSYLIKPLVMDKLLNQVERAVSMRLFHVRGLHLIKNHADSAPDFSGHLHDITSLYHFSRKLLLTLDVKEVMRIILEEANQQMKAAFSVVGVSFLQFRELYAMPRVGELDPKTVRTMLARQWSPSFSILDRAAVEQELYPLEMFRGREGEADVAAEEQPLVIPMNVLGETIGFLAVFGRQNRELPPDRVQFLHVFASLVSSTLEHAYHDVQAKRLAKTDSLTGIGNHRMFHETLEKEISRANRHGHKFCLALIDIDDFKKINDTYGHPVGDIILKDLSKRMGEVIRRDDVVARYGGEEFGLILPSTDLEGGQVLASRVLESIASQPFPLSRKQISCTVSIGLTQYDGREPLEKDELVSRADAALYDSKRAGKHRVTTR